MKRIKFFIALLIYYTLILPLIPIELIELLSRKLKELDWVNNWVDSAAKFAKSIFK